MSTGDGILICIISWWKWTEFSTSVSENAHPNESVSSSRGTTLVGLDVLGNWNEFTNPLVRREVCNVSCDVCLDAKWNSDDFHAQSQPENQLQ